MNRSISGRIFPAELSVLPAALLLATLLAPLGGCGRAPPPVVSKPAPPPPPAESQGVPLPDAPTVADARSAARIEAAATGDSLSTPPVNASPSGVRPLDTGRRVLVFTPGGPLIVELFLHVDGRPVAAATDRLVEQLLSMADANGDGRSTWAEAFDDPRFSLLEAHLPPADAAERDPKRQTYDTNGDGVLDRAEAERFVAQGAAAGRLALRAGSYRGLSFYRSRIRQLTDANDDGRLSVDEARTAGQELRLLDADGNELIDPIELVDRAPEQLSDAMARRPADQAPVPLAFLLDSRANWHALLFALSELYLHDGVLGPRSFPLSPDLFAELDLDEDGVLEREECAQFNHVKPHLEVDIHLGSPPSPPGGEAPASPIAVRAVAAGLKVVEASPPDGLLLELPGLKLQLALDAGLERPDPQATAETMLARLDADKNGYLEAGELEADGLPENPLAAWDADSDGKVFLAELVRYYRQQLPPLGNVVLSADEPEDLLFWVLDSSGDGRLSPRELHAAADRLSALDANDDGEIAADELPKVAVLRVEPDERDEADRPATMAAPLRARRPVAGPAWFGAMDRNGDGDVTPAEFVGTSDQFRQVDLNADGFLDPAEAQSYE